MLLLRLGGPWAAASQRVRSFRDATEAVSVSYRPSCSAAVSRIPASRVSSHLRTGCDSTWRSSISTSPNVVSPRIWDATPPAAAVLASQIGANRWDATPPAAALLQSSHLDVARIGGMRTPLCRHLYKLVTDTTKHKWTTSGGPFDIRTAESTHRANGHTARIASVELCLRALIASDN